MQDDEISKIEIPVTLNAGHWALLAGMLRVHLDQPDAPYFADMMVVRAKIQKTILNYAERIKDAERTETNLQ